MRELSLSQKYYLCSVGDKGRYSGLDSEKTTALVAAGILEVLMDGILELNDGKLRVKLTRPAEIGHLGGLFDYVRSCQPVRPQSVAEHYTYNISTRDVDALAEATGRSLAELGFAGEERAGLFGRRPAFVPQKQARDRVVEAMRAELLEDGPLTADTVALAALLKRSGDLKKYFSAYERESLKTRLREIKSSPENRLVSQMVDYIDNMLSIMTVTVFATGSI